MLNLSTDAQQDVCQFLTLSEFINLTCVSRELFSLHQTPIWRYYYERELQHEIYSLQQTLSTNHTPTAHVRHRTKRIKKRIEYCKRILGFKHQDMNSRQQLLNHIEKNRLFSFKRQAVRAIWMVDHFSSFTQIISVINPLFNRAMILNNLFNNKAFLKAFNDPVNCRTMINALLDRIASLGFQNRISYYTWKWDNDQPFMKDMQKKEETMLIKDFVYRVCDRIPVQHTRQPRSPKRLEHWDDAYAFTLTRTVRTKQEDLVLFFLHRFISEAKERGMKQHFIDHVISQALNCNFNEKALLATFNLFLQEGVINARVLDTQMEEYSVTLRQKMRELLPTNWESQFDVSIIY
jgi:hypothetical protein